MPWPGRPRWPAIVDTELFDVRTGIRLVTDVTDLVARFCSGRGSGLCHLFVPHATAGLGLMELGSGSEDDLAEVLGRLFPRDERYRHRHGSVGHGGDHLLPLFVGPALSLPVVDGRPLLGTWQAVALVDPNRDNQARHVRCSWLPA